MILKGFKILCECGSEATLNTSEISYEQYIDGDIEMVAVREGSINCNNTKDCGNFVTLEFD